MPIIKEKKKEKINEITIVSGYSRDVGYFCAFVGID
jgi:hypothetical protein